MKKKKINKSGTKNINSFVKSVLEVFQTNPFTGFNYKEVSQRMGISDEASKKLVRDIIEKLSASNQLVTIKKGKYQINRENKGYLTQVNTHITGSVDMKQTGKAYVIPEDNSEDIYIAPVNTGHALHGDTVKVMLFPKRKGKKTEGQIVEILQRRKKQFVGTIEIARNFAFLIPDSPSMPVDIIIPHTHLNGAKNGQKVIATISEWPPQSENPFGEVINVLGKPGDNNVEMESILAEFEFPLSFNPKSEK